MTLIPGSFAVNPTLDNVTIQGKVHTLSAQLVNVDVNTLPTKDALNITQIKKNLSNLDALLTKTDFDKLAVRKDILNIADSYSNLDIVKLGSIVPNANASENITHPLINIKKDVDALAKTTDYVAWWIIVLVSIAIGSGTMIGWKRIVETIGEKIGKYKMNYSQAASSALVTAGAIGIASGLGLPVSTTHIMSSSVAGTMVEEHGWKNGVDPHMIKHILLAWVLTMPTTIILAASIFLVLKWVFI